MTDAIPGWLQPVDRLAVADFIVTGTCHEGLRPWLDRHLPTASTFPTASVLSQFELNAEHLVYFRRAARLDGDGVGEAYGGVVANDLGGGFGFGLTYGDGDADGEGFGDPIGEGDGDGLGTGQHAYGLGREAGDGEGDAFADAEGEGYGYGDGHAYGFSGRDFRKPGTTDPKSYLCGDGYGR